MSSTDVASMKKLNDVIYKVENVFKCVSKTALSRWKQNKPMLFNSFKENYRKNTIKPTCVMRRYENVRVVLSNSIKIARERI